jgi:hypothetical protein
VPEAMQHFIGPISQESFCKNGAANMPGVNIYWHAWHTMHAIMPMPSLLIAGISHRSYKMGLLFDTRVSFGMLDSNGLFCNYRSLLFLE